MNSDNAMYERAFKLLASLMELILHNKRHLALVCAALQRLVFESLGWPTYKNWPVICKIGRTDRLMMIVLATLDLSKPNDPAVQNIVAAFPQCFSDKKVQGPVPWSTMLEHTAKRSDRSEPNFMRTYGTISYFGLPMLVLSDDADIRKRDASVFPCPDDAWCGKDSPIGTTVEFMGKRFVIVENRLDGFSYGDPDMTLVPAECIALDL